jgi:hypothetical protein
MTRYRSRLSATRAFVEAAIKAGTVKVLSPGVYRVRGLGTTEGHLRLRSSWRRRGCSRSIPTGRPD